MPFRRSSLDKPRATPAEARKKAERYCAYQDRCHQEVRRKLYDLGLYGEDVDQVMAQLIEDRFLDEERFARSFARGKFRMKKWGRQRIERELKSRRVSAYCIRKGLSEIDDAAYDETLRGLLRKRLARKGADLHPYARRGMLVEHGLRKGYSMDDSIRVAREVIAEAEAADTDDAATP